jgi:hypothetical protein
MSGRRWTALTIGVLTILLALYLSQTQFEQSLPRSGAPRELPLPLPVPEEERQAPIAGIALRPFAEGTNWVLVEPLVYRVGDSRDSVIVPKGFVTDFASIPPRLQGLISSLGPYVLPAVVHDYLYWEHRCSRTQSDRLFLLAMQEQGVPYVKRSAMYEAVNGFGRAAWTENARDRLNGLPRIIPDVGVRRPAVLERWRDYRNYLRSAHVRPMSSTSISSRFCVHGN